MVGKRVLYFIFLIFLFFSQIFSQEDFRKFPPSPEPFRELKLPKEKRYKLANGLNISFFYRRNTPIISLCLLISAGEIYSPKDLPGLATITARLLDNGTDFISSERLKEEIEYIGGRFSVKTEADYSIVYFSFLEEYINEALDILKKIVVEPSFPQREVVKEMRELFFELKKRKSSANFLGRERLFKVLFPENHPYHNFFPKTDSLRKINRKKILEFYKTYYRPNNSYLIIIGDLNFRELIRKVSHYLNVWESRKIPKILFPPVDTHKEEIIYFVDSPSIQRPFICLGNLFFLRNRMDYFPLLVLNQILGGTTTSRLFMNLRETKEIAFSARSYLEFFKNCGVYILEAEVKPEAVKESIEECISELKKIANSRIPLLELEQAKYYLIGNFPIQLNKENGLMNYLIKRFIVGLGEQNWNRYQHNIMSVDHEMVSLISKRYFASHPAIVVVGNRKKILEPLLDFEIIEVYDIEGNLKYKIEKGIK